MMWYKTVEVQNDLANTVDFECPTLQKYGPKDLANPGSNRTRSGHTKMDVIRDVIRARLQAGSVRSMHAVVC